MINSKDYDIKIEDSASGTTVKVVHKPTGNVRCADSVSPDLVGTVRDNLIAELRGQLFRPEDVRFDTGRSEGGDFIRVIHVPSGIERSAMRCKSSHEQLLDLVLEELHSRA